MGSTTASVGSAPPPAATLIESFQADLFTGRATTSIPITVPPGRKGLQPNLVLAYASSSRNSLAGVGWSLELGSIERSTKRGVPKYDGSDAFLLEFQGVTFELVPTGANTYRAKDEGLFLRITFLGSSGWEVRNTSGTRYLFGQAPNSEQPGAGGIFRWHLTKVIDTNNNYLLITYTQDQGQVYPYQMHYTGHEPTLSPTNLVEFAWELRADRDVSYRSGTKVTTAQRLKAITVKAIAQLVRTYQLTYADSARTRRSLLSSITIIGADGTSTLPVSSFTYQSATEPTYTLSSNTGLSGSNLWNVTFKSDSWGDLNGATLYPSQVRAYNAPTYTQPAGNFPGFGWSIDSLGNIAVGADQDMNLLFWTYVYVDSARNINVNLSQSEDSQIRFFLNGSLSEVPGWPTKSLALQQGWNLIEITSYNQNAGFGWNMSGSLASQVGIMNPTQFLHPSLSGDFNGDGLTDLAFFDAPNATWKVGISSGSNFQVNQVWRTGFGSTSDAPVLGDWDGDGKTDIATYSGGAWKFATSTGASFQRTSSMDVSFVSGTPFIGDFNGDGTTDLGTYNAGAWSIALGSGSGFSQTSSFTVNWGTSSHQPLTGDFNGDGLTDIALVTTSLGQIDVRLSNGSSWSGASQWVSNFGTNKDLIAADFNGDGLTDAAYYDKSTGRVLPALSTGTAFTPASTPLPVTFSLRDALHDVQVGDFNGDGLADPAVFHPITGNGELTFSSGQAVDLLSTQTNALGGSVSLTYVPSSLLDNTGGDGLPDLPFVVPVVNTLTSRDGMGNAYVTRYSYAGGVYDAQDKEFRGFAQVTVTDPQGTRSELLFHQDPQKKGRLERSRLADAGGNLYAEELNTWTCETPAPGVSLCHLARTVSRSFDGDATFKETASSYAYDNYGNMAEITEEGEPGLSGDERITRVTYALNPTDWLLNRPASIAVYGADGATRLKEQRFYYDSHPGLTDPPAAGNLTRVEEWLNTGDAYLGTTLSYDAYGNATGITDPRNSTTRLAYDTGTHTFLSGLTNALGHSQQLERDARFGVVTRAIDANGVATRTGYDVFGRPITVIGPNDTDSLPTATFAYELSTTPGTPSRMTTQARERSGGSSVLTTYAFLDGLGRTLQVRSPAENAGWQVVDGVVEFDNRGLVAKAYLPYFSAFADSYVPLSLEPSGSSLPFASNTHDPIGRLVAITDPDSSISQANYDDWTVTLTDANSHQTRYTQDAHGRLALVEERNESATYPTRYAYDPLDQLLQVTDAADHVTILAYDSLGRKIAMDDPDMGRWTYAYDGVDNLIAQTDARGVTTNFTYDDALGRLTQKSYDVPANSGIVNPGPVTYRYDQTDAANPYARGALTELSDAASTLRLTYDNLGRVTKERSIIGSATYDFQSAYDLLDRPTTLTYPDGDAVVYTYNPQGGLETVALQPPASSPRSIVTSAAYDAAGQVTRLAYGNGVVTDYTYEPATLQLDRLQTAGPGGPLQDLDYDYDAVGNIIRLADGVSGDTQTFTYDGLDRLTAATGAYGSPSYSYDAVGNLLAKGSTTLSYPPPTEPQPHAVRSTSDGRHFTYDAVGNLLSETADTQTPAAQALAAKRFRFDADNRLVQVDVPKTETVSVTFAPGWNFFSLPVIPNDLSIAALFPSFGTDIDQISRYNPETNRFEDYVGDTRFDDFTELAYGRGYEVYCANPTGVTLTLTGAVPTAAPAYALSAGSHLVGSSALESQTPGWLLSGVDYDSLYRYDTESRSLTTASQVKLAEAYFVHVTSAGSWRPPLPRDVATRMTYDAAGNRLKRSTASETVTVVNEAYEVGPGGATKQLFAGGLRIGAKRSDGTLEFSHGDHLGSTNVLTNGAGSQLARLTYRPFGELASATGADGVVHRFTGQRFDQSTGLYFYQARYYDPSIGRFLSADPLVQDPTDPQFLNRFAYVRNNPVRFVDPSGLEAVVTGELISSIILTIAAYFFSKWLFGKKEGGTHPSLPPGPIQPTAFTPLVPLLPGVSFAQIQQGAQTVGSFVGNAIFDYETFSQAAALLRIGTGPEKLLALVAMGAIPLDAVSNVIPQVGGGKAVAKRTLVEGVQEVPTILKAGRRFSRFMLKAEQKAVEESHLLRGGKPGRTYLTRNKFRKASSAKSKLSLEHSPEVRMDFKLKKDLRVTGPTKVKPKHGQLGEGEEFFSTEPVEVDIIRTRPLQ